MHVAQLLVAAACLIEDAVTKGGQITSSSGGSGVKSCQTLLLPALFLPRLLPLVLGRRAGFVLPNYYSRITRTLVHCGRTMPPTLMLLSLFIFCAAIFSMQVGQGPLFHSSNLKDHVGIKAIAHD